MEKPPAAEFSGPRRFAVVRRIGAGGMGQSPLLRELLK